VIFVPKDIEHVLEELETETDRSVAIVGASLIEASLQSAIASMLRPIEDDKDVLGSLFGELGIFSSVDAKILAAYALRIFGANCRRDLTLINTIRNQFAHDMNPLSFDDDHIRDGCKLLSVPQNNLAHGNNPRLEYLVSVRHYSAALDMYSRKELMEEDDRFELLLQLAS
jgi:DNA-binding MltR family transcriptional regulator